MSKVSILNCAIFLMMVNKVFSQSEYQPIFTQNTRWELYVIDEKLNGESKTLLTHRDTTLGNKSYTMFAGENKTNNLVLIREDVNDKKVYVFEDGKEFLLYDFNLAIGDKFYIKQWEFVVINKTKVMTKEGERTCIELKPQSFTWDNLKWVEGMGASIAPLYYKYYTKLNESPQITCFFRDKKLVYNVEDWKCELPSSVSNDEINFNAKVKLFPNPFIDNLQIEIENQNSKNIEISIHNILGAAIYYKKYENTNEKLSETLDLKNIANGLYFLTIKNGSHKITKRIVKE